MNVMNHVCRDLPGESYRTDRQLRAVRRERRLRREQRLRRERIRKGMLALMSVCLIAVCVLSYRSIQSSAGTGGEAMSFKYYTDITVSRGETLWEIADDYIDYGQYKDKEAYIAEVRSINHIPEEEGIRAGQTLIVPYYSSEFVK